MYQLGAVGSGRRSGDRELLAYVGRHGVVSIAHVMAALDLRQASAYRHVAALIDVGLLERIDLLSGEPSLLRSTRAGLRSAGLGMAPAILTPGAVDHWLRCADAARILGERHGHHRILTERELALAERHEGRPIASAKIGELPSGHPRLHRPDLVVLPDGHPLAFPDCGSLAAYAGSRERTEHHTDQMLGSGSQGPSSPRTQGGDPRTEDTGMRSVPAGLIAVEVELTPKSPKRLREIIRGWRRADWVAEVHYLCEPGQTRRAVERAVEKLHAADRILIEAAPRRTERDSRSAASGSSRQRAEREQVS